MLAYPSQEDNSGNFAALLGMLTTRSGLQIQTTIRWQQIEICNSMFPCSTFLVSTHWNYLLGLPSVLFCSHLSSWPRQISRFFGGLYYPCCSSWPCWRLKWDPLSASPRLTATFSLINSMPLLLNVCRDSWAQLPKWLCEPCKRHSCFKDSRRIWFLMYLIWRVCKTIISNTCLL